MAKKTMFKELIAYIKRNGVGQFLYYILEMYIGGILKIFPGIEGLFMRGWFFKLMFKKGSSKPYIYPMVTIIFSRNIYTGNRVVINIGSYLDARGGIRIGDNVMIGPNSVLSSCDHGHDDITIAMSKQQVIYGEIIIEDDVWIGANCVITKGVTIKEGCIIAAGSVVTKSTEPYMIYGGTPARILRKRG